MKNFLTATAVIEVGAGLALLIAPAFAVQLLLGAGISGAGISLGRVAGAALLALGVACWLARSDALGSASRGLVTAMLVYNFGAVSVLGAAGIQSQTAGVVLWLAVVLHAALGIWCIALLSKKAALHN
jgi:hypothetical protein